MVREGLSSHYYHPSPNNLHHHQNFNMSLHHAQSPGQSTSRGHHGHPSQLPGGGGLYSMSELPSPLNSFQMSMVESSTPTNMMQHSRVGGGMGGGMPQMRSGLRGDMSTVKDLNNYVPIHKIKLDEYPRRLFTVENSVTRETVVVVTCTQKIMLFILKIKGDEDAKKPSEKFEFTKFHEFSLQPNDLEGFVISQNCSITLSPLKLTYALSTRGGSNVYVYDQGDSTQVPASLSLGELSQEGPSTQITQFQHDYPVTNLAIDAEKDYLACIEELGTIVVWDIHQTPQVKLAVFHIPHQGIYIAFHRSEPYQLMVIDSSGWVRFFNVFRQCCYRSIHLVQSNVVSAEWSASSPNIFAAGFAEAFTIVDTCKALSSMNKTYDVPEQIINAIKMNPGDDKVIATLSRLTGTIQLWRDNFATQIWKHQNPHVNDIAWVHDYPYLLALGHQTLFIYESSQS